MQRVQIVQICAFYSTVQHSRYSIPESICGSRRRSAQSVRFSAEFKYRGIAFFRSSEVKMSGVRASKVKTRSSTCDGSQPSRVRQFQYQSSRNTNTSDVFLSTSPPQSIDKGRRVSIGVAFINRLSNTVSAARRASNVPGGGFAAFGGRARDDSGIPLSSGRRRSDFESAISSFANCNVSDNELFSSGVKPTIRTRCGFISQQQATAIDEELFNEYGFSVDQLMELAGLASATAFAQAYPRETLTKAHGAVLVCCGPGNNGGDGLVCARHLKLFGYQPTIFYPKVPDKTLFKNLLKQCEKFEIPSLAYLPSDVNSIQQSFNVLVDAVFGFSFKPPIREEFVPLMRTMRLISIPIFSIDIPSGWDVENGPRDAEAIQPDVLISLTAPKFCARHFNGRAHYLGGRFVPNLLAQKYKMRLPDYPGTDLVVELPVASSISATDTDTDSNDMSQPEKPSSRDIWGAT